MFCVLFGSFACKDIVKVFVLIMESQLTFWRLSCPSGLFISLAIEHQINEQEWAVRSVLFRKILGVRGRSYISEFFDFFFSQGNNRFIIKLLNKCTNLTLI